ncbi:MAG: hypothetical protein ACYCYA_12590, partial [Actinomycetes bacterium]
DRLADLLASLAAVVSGPDVLLDAGRLGPKQSNPVLEAELRLLVLRPTLRGASAARSHITWPNGAAGASEGSGLLLVGDGAYRAQEISGALGVPVLGAIAEDPVSAAILCGERVAGRGFDRGPLIRSARSLSEDLLRHLSESASGTAKPVANPVPEETVAASEMPAGRLG